MTHDYDTFLKDNDKLCIGAQLLAIKGRVRKTKIIQLDKQLKKKKTKRLKNREKVSNITQQQLFITIRRKSRRNFNLKTSI